VSAVPSRAFPVIQAGVFVFAVIFVVINVLVDVLYTIVDPYVFWYKRVVDVIGAKDRSRA
jgi:ABC-type dipeptide/oligopeptide/nickel transport system permease component